MYNPALLFRYSLVLATKPVCQTGCSEGKCVISINGKRLATPLPSHSAEPKPLHIFALTTVAAAQLSNNEGLQLPVLLSDIKLNTWLCVLRLACCLTQALLSASAAFCLDFAYRKQPR